MTAVSEDATADLNRRIAELEQRLETALIERDAEIERQTANALVNFRLQSELRATAERQNAGAEILRTIANTKGDAENALQRIGETTAHFFNAAGVTIRIAEGDEWVQAIRVGSGSQLTGGQPAAQLTTRGANLPATVYRDNRQIHIPDLDNIDPSMADWPATAARAAGIRTICGTPLRRDGKAIGAMIVYRDRLAAFTDEELALQQTFADQAVIAIENARLFNETQEALERQTATADILKVIASSPSDVQPVFDAIAERSNQLINGSSTSVLSLVDDALHVVAYTKVSPAADAALRAYYPQPLSTFAWGETVRRGEIIQIPDSEDEAATPAAVREVARARGWRSATLVPLLRDQKPIGMISVTRRNTGLFADHHVQLLQTFADQAVIAIENTRLFNETQQALERQTATADILKVIARSPSDVQPVFDAILTRALHLCEAAFGFLTTYNGERFEVAAHRGLPPALVEHFGAGMDQPQPGDAHWRLKDGEELIHHLDQKDEDAYRAGNPLRRTVVDLGGVRSALVVALRHGGALRGAITIYRKEVRPFSPSQTDLLRHFADQAVIAIENARLFNETQQALERQTATADILKVIASSPSDTTPVFEAIASSANRLLAGFSTAVFRLSDDTVYLASFTPTHPAADEALKADFPKPVDEFEPIRLTRPGEPFAIPDTEEIPYAPIRDIARLHGFRSMLFVPLMNAGLPIGVISVTRAEPGGFAPHHVQLLQTFADQAVIAIENTRLFNEVQAKTRDLEESLQQQTATADVLKVISRSAFDLQAVLDTLVESAARLCEADHGIIVRPRDDQHRVAASWGLPPETRAYLESRKFLAGENSAAGRALLEARVIHIEDVFGSRDYVLAGDPKPARTRLAVPLLREGKPIGIFALTRQQVQPFTDKQIELVQTFADQAVIAIENARLFDEVQAKTRDLTEALTYQTGSANILNVIASSPTDVEPVLKAVVESACALCEAYDAVVMLKDGDELRVGAHQGPISMSRRRWPTDRTSISGRAMADRRPVHVRDVLSDEGAEFAVAREMSRIDRCHTLLGAPLLREGESIGAIVLRRAEVHPFSDKQIALLQTFADQAVIALGNVRLFEEVQARTRELSESLQQQTATSEVLQIISSSPSDLAPVFDKMLENATRVCGAEFGSMMLIEDGSARQVALYNAPAALAAARADRVFHPQPQGPMATVIQTRQAVQVADMRTTPGYLERHQTTLELVDLGGARTVAVVPMLREDDVIGTITIYRQEIRPFSDKQIELVSNFAKQAVIAIENARLLRELRQRTDDLTESLQFQTASAEVLKVISRSPDTLQPVLDVIVETSRELCGALTSVIFLLRDGMFRHAADSVDQDFRKPEYIETFRTNPIAPDQVGSILARATREKRTVNIPNTEEDPEAGLGGPMDSGGPKALLCVPLVLDGRIIGAITLRQSHLTPFTLRQIEAVETFADQAIIAISNVNLFEQVQQRTRELAKSLEDLRTAQGRLIQTEKLASLGQLTAGIAHEIKNPLNFVNNFSALSIEITDELNELLRQTELSDKLRMEADELTGLLKDNLGKVVQHGKRADSIVKNMLLHSREGSGEHRPADVNALVDESLNLAYHGARAEKPQFNVTLRRDFDPGAGMVEVFPQEITRVLLNVISNGFYAVIKRKAAYGDADFEPVLTATTKGAADHVEIRIRDNGTGIPPEVRERMFNPFFTTKPAGEGTGLGLSMSHDIIVKQHGGSIEVETEPGAFTEFRILLRRSSLFGQTAGS